MATNGLSVTIPVNLLTPRALNGLDLLRYGGNLSENPDAAVLDDWLKEHGVDCRTLSEATSPIRSQQGWTWHAYLKNISCGPPWSWHPGLLQTLSEWLPVIEEPDSSGLWHRYLGDQLVHQHVFAELTGLMYFDLDKQCYEHVYQALWKEKCPNNTSCTLVYGS